MPHDSNDESTYEYIPDDNWKNLTVTFRVGDHPFEYEEPEADEPIILCKDGTVLPVVSGSDPEVYTYEPWVTEEIVLLKSPYEWTDREMDVEAALQYNRVRSTPDPTVGRFIEEEPDSSGSQASDH